MSERNNLASICKIAIAAFILYVCWFKYVYGEVVIIIYITGAAAIGCMTVDMLRNNDRFTGVFPYGVTTNIIMCAYSVITGFFVAVSTSVLISQVKTYLSYSLICMAICYVVYAEKSIDWLAKILVFTSVLCCIQVFTRGYYNYLYGYVMSPDNNPHSLGLVLDMGIFGIAYTNTKKSAWRKAVRYALIGMFIYVIVGCGSRKCLIAALIITAIWLLPQIRETMTKGSGAVKFGTVTAIIAVIILVLYYYNTVYLHSITHDRMQLLGDTRNASGSSARREYYYQVAIELFLDNPAFGIGFEQFRFNNIYGSFSHSTFAEALASWGLLGSMLYFAPVLAAGVRTIKMAVSKKASYVVQVILAFWVMEIFLGIGQIWYYTVEHMIAWTLIFILVQVQQETLAIPERQCKYIRA